MIQGRIISVVFVVLLALFLGALVTGPAWAVIVNTEVTHQGEPVPNATISFETPQGDPIEIRKPDEDPQTVTDKKVETDDDGKVAILVPDQYKDTPVVVVIEQDGKVVRREIVTLTGDTFNLAVDVPHPSGTPPGELTQLDPRRILPPIGPSGVPSLPPAPYRPGPSITGGPTLIRIPGLSSGYLKGEDNNGDLISPLVVVEDDMNLTGGTLTLKGIGFPIPGAPTAVVDFSGSFATGETDTRVLGAPGGTAGMGLPFADFNKNNRGVFVNDPNATADLFNQREITIYDISAGVWVPIGGPPNANVSVGLGGGFTNIDTQELTAFKVDTFLGDVDGTYRHDGESNCIRGYGGAQFRSTPSGPGGVSFHMKALAGVNRCQTDYRSDAVVNVGGTPFAEGGGSFSDTENFFYGEVGGGVDFPCPLLSQARCSVGGSVSTGAWLIPVLDFNSGDPAPDIPAIIVYENQVAYGVNANIIITFGGGPPPDLTVSDRPLPVTAQTPLQVVPQRPLYRETATSCGSNANIVFSQLSLQLDGNSHNDTGWGRAHLSYDGDPNVSTQFLNLVVNNATVARNLPVRPGDKPGQQIDLMLWVNLGVPDGTQVDQITYGCSVTPNRPIGAPDKDEETAEVKDAKIELWSDFWKETLTYQGPQSDKDRLWYPSTEYDVIDSAFHTWELIQNQECGLGECFPAAISNSFKMMLRSHPKKLEHLSDDPNKDNDDTDIKTFKRGSWTGWVEADGAIKGSTAGSTTGMSNDPEAGFNKFKAKLEFDPAYPFEAEIIDDPKDLNTILEVIKKKGDCKLLGNAHAMLITGVISLKNGDYLFEIADDSDQGEAGGTDVRLVKYDTSANEFSGYVLGGMSMTKGKGTVGGNVIFVCETVQ